MEFSLKKIASKLLTPFIATSLLTLASTSVNAAPHWGEFRDDGLQTIKIDGQDVKVRVYQSILWGIPPGESWEEVCSKTPAKVAGHHFSHPTACVKSTIAQPLSAISTALGAIGYVSPVSGAIGTVGSIGATVLDLTGAGGLNMWGVFYVPQQKSSASTTLYTRRFDRGKFAPVTSQQVLTKKDNWRGWSWDGRTASYIAVNGKGQTVLYIRPFNGRSFGSVTSQQVVAKGDNWRGWSWDGSTASYIAVNGKGQTVLYTRPFNGKSFGSVASQRVLTQRDNWRGWNWKTGFASYVAK